MTVESPENTAEEARLSKPNEVGPRVATPGSAARILTGSDLSVESKGLK